MSKRSQPFGRHAPSLSVKPRVVISCEGAKTERYYFQDLNRINRLSSARVIVLDHRGTDPRTVVDTVAQFMRQQRKEQRWTPEDQAWAVFDGDEHQATSQQMENWNAAMQMANDLNINLAISNPSFEFWYLLHYQDHYSHLTRDKALELLRAHLPRYEKSDRLYTTLQPHTEQALRRAQTIAKQAGEKGLQKHNNPCCDGVARLVESLLKLK